MKTSVLIVFAMVLFSLFGTVQYIHAEDCFYVTRYTPCIDSKYSDYFTTTFSGIDPSFTLAKLDWKEASFPIKNGTGFVTVILKDPDLNRDVSYKETANVLVYSDSDSEFHVIELRETESNSGKFERTFGISDSRSAPSVILTRDGDTIGVVYVDTTMPPDHFGSDAYLMSTALIGSTGPPLERAPASDPKILDVSGNLIDSTAVGEQIQITSDITNEQNREQKFAYIVMIHDDTETVVYLAWIDGTLNSESSFSLSASWIPQNAGNYVATMFVWESITNPTALSPPIHIDFTVSDENTTHSLPDDKIMCSGTALCLTEKILRIVDGDTIYLSGGYEVRLSLTNTPERHQIGFYDASRFTAEMCPVTSTVTVDQDDLQPYDAYDRLLGKVTCDHKTLNAELLYAGHANILTQFCFTSEFSSELWAQEFGC
ncbi:thermonuclease family protein [Nitrosopumilus sp. b2]|uniref:thermonuclease family protein n=1 Tax=Nitrosopumilus sp. b2 TaxID=2109908 RepID=UPI002105F51E|nr:thermonuclease family protein [Nitrosopumilus sp. b2]